jgi:hypothetical protein
MSSLPSRRSVVRGRLVGLVDSALNIDASLKKAALQAANDAFFP